MKQIPEMIWEKPWFKSFQLFKRNDALVAASQIVDEKKETVIWEFEKNVYNERKGKCFPVLIKRKTLSFVKVVFSVLIGIKFSLTSFPCCCQTWENKESEFQEFTFLQSNTPLLYSIGFFFLVFKKYFWKNLEIIYLFFKINIFYIFLNYFNILILKINLKKYYVYHSHIFLL